MVKWLSAASPNRAALARYRYAYAVARDLDLPGVTRTIATIKVHDRPALIFLDHGGRSLRSWLDVGRRLSQVEVARLGAAVADALAGLHAAGVVHRDINPSKICLLGDDGDCGKIERIDFDVATKLRREAIAAQAVDKLEGTLAYLSPEQTGRMNRHLDHRTDLYALGVTLYELLAGERPFESSDPLTLVHAHLALEPTPLQQRDPSIAPALAAIIAKLLQKDPDARYLSAAGLRRDLLRCADAIAAATQAGASAASVMSWTLGEGDVTPWLQLSQRIVGRDADLSVIRAALDDARGGGRGLLLVRGAAGVGKTSLIREGIAAVHVGGGRFVSGKYNQLQNAPYAGLLTAVRSLVVSLLGGSDTELAHWRATLSGALALNAAVMTAVVPELLQIIGEPAPPPPLPPAEALARFQRTFLAMMRCLSGPGRPLVIFLDDLQWAGGNSLELLAALLQDEGASHRLLIGALRDEDAAACAAIDVFVAQLKGRGVRPRELALGPLDEAGLAEVIGDTLGRRGDQALAPLVAAIHQRSHGNPFFALQMLLRLEEDAVLGFEPRSGAWGFDAARLSHLAISDQVADLLAAKLQRLPQATRDVLRVAAALGNQADLEALCALTAQTPTQVRDALWPAAEASIIALPAGAWRDIDDAALAGASTRSPLRFGHDKLQEAAYALTPADQRPPLHLQIAVRLAALPEAAARRFDVVNHFNLGAACIESPDERVALAERNLAAARQAMAASAFGKVQTYAAAGMAMLEPEPWQRAPQLQFDLKRLYAESAQLNGAFNDAMVALDEAATHARTPPQQIDIADLRIQLHARVGDTLSAIDAGLAAYASLDGFTPPTDPPGWMAAAMGEAAGIGAALQGRDALALLDAPMLQDPAVFLQLRLLTSLVGPSYTRVEVLPFVVMRIVRLSITHGTSPFAPLGYMTYAVLLCARGDVEGGSRFGELALALAKRFGARALEAPLYQIYGPFVQHWTQGLSSTTTSLHHAMAAGIESGAYVFAGWAANNLPLAALVRGDELESAMQDAETVGRVLADTPNARDGVVLNRKLRQSILRLAGADTQAAALADEGGELSPQSTASFGDFILYAALMEHVWGGDIDKAREVVQTIAPRLARATAHFFVPMYRYLAGVVAAHDSDDAATLEDHAATLERYAAFGQPAYGAAAAHLRAEQRAIAGDLRGAEDAFDAASDLANEAGAPHIALLIYERAAGWMERAGRSRVARSFLVEAHDAAVRWGGDSQDAPARGALPAAAWRQARSVAHDLDRQPRRRHARSAGRIARQPGHQLHIAHRRSAADGDAHRRRERRRAARRVVAAA